MHKSSVVSELLQKYPLISDQVDRQELAVILQELERQLEGGALGSVVEFGCYVGTTSLFIRRLLDHYNFTGGFHVYDSFSGLPDKTAADLSPAGEQFKTGELAISRKVFEQQFKKAGLRLPRIHKGWFAELQSSDIPEQIGFAYLDGDYYESIADSLRLIEPQLTPKATIVIDDYANEALPGAAKATNEWLKAHTEATIRVEASLAVVVV